MNMSPIALKRSAASVLAAALAASVLVVAAPSPAQAVTGVGIESGSCNLVNGAGQVVNVTNVKITKNKKNKTWKCKGTVSPALNKKGKKKAAFFSGRRSGGTCATPNGTTSRWHETVSASGRATLVCHYR